MIKIIHLQNKHVPYNQGGFIVGLLHKTALIVAQRL